MPVSPPTRHVVTRFHNALPPGPGWGGSCLPKDTNALEQVAAAAGIELPLVSAGISTNARQRRIVVDKIAEAVAAGRRLGLLGLTFKAGTDDLRDSPAPAVARLLHAAGAELTAYDPGCRAAVPGVTDAVAVVDEPLLAAKDADALVVLTEWPEFRSLDWAAVAGALAGPTVVDCRNLLDPDVLRRAGISWVGIGRPRYSL